MMMSLQIYIIKWPNCNQNWKDGIQCCFKLVIWMLHWFSKNMMLNSNWIENSFWWRMSKQIRGFLYMKEIWVNLKMLSKDIEWITMFLRHCKTIKVKRKIIFISWLLPWTNHIYTISKVPISKEPIKNLTLRNETWAKKISKQKNNIKN